MDNCLEDGLWLFQNKPTLLQKWHLGMELSKVCPKSIPLWIKFYDVPMKLWNPVGLSYMASTVGKPITLDRITKETCQDKLGRIGFVRILLEIDASWNLSNKIRMRMPSDENSERKPMEVSVYYQCKPSHCARCLVFEHASNSCPFLLKPIEKRPADAGLKHVQAEKGGFKVVSCKGKG